MKKINVFMVMMILISSSIIFNIEIVKSTDLQNPEFSKTTSNAKWTVMSYMSGSYQPDSYLEKFHIENFEEMAEVGSNEDVNVVVQLNRNSDPNSETSYGDWSGANRFFVEKGMEPTVENAIADWGDGQGGRSVDMNNKNTIINFCKWAKTNYPADSYLLVLASHGHGLRGLFSWMSGDLNYIFSEIPGGIDILVFEACYMGTVEIADGLYPYVDYMI